MNILQCFLQLLMIPRPFCMIVKIILLLLTKPLSCWFKIRISNPILFTAVDIYMHAYIMPTFSSRFYSLPLDCLYSNVFLRESCLRVIYNRQMFHRRQTHRKRYKSNYYALYMETETYWPACMRNDVGQVSTNFLACILLVN